MKFYIDFNRGSHDDEILRQLGCIEEKQNGDSIGFYKELETLDDLQLFQEELNEFNQYKYYYMIIDFDSNSGNSIYFDYPNN